MSAARVVNPFSLNEIRRLRDSVRCQLVPDPEARARVCRNLYGRSSAEDSRAFVNRELAVQREQAAERWGFDFIREVPRSSDRFIWCKVKTGGVPEAYGLRRMAFLGGALAVKASAVPILAPLPPPPPVNAAAQPDAAYMETASTTVASAASRRHPATPVALPTKASDRTPSPPVSSVQTAVTLTRQAHITDYLKCRKRLSTSTKATGTVPPAKRARIS